MKQRIKARGHFPGTVATKLKAVQEKWDRLIPSEWNRLIDSMPDRIKECREKKGTETRY